MTKAGPLIILANAHDARAPAAMIARRLEGLGYTVDQRSVPDAFADDLAGAQRLLLIWSRGAAADADLTSKTHAGKLSVVRLASSPSPAKLRGVSVRLPRGSDAQGWRRLAEGATAAMRVVAPATRKAVAAAEPARKRGGGWVVGTSLAVALLGAAAAAALIARPDLLAGMGF